MLLTLYAHISCVDTPLVSFLHPVHVVVPLIYITRSRLERPPEPNARQLRKGPSPALRLIRSTACHVPTFREYSIKATAYRVPGSFKGIGELATGKVILYSKCLPRSLVVEEKTELERFPRCSARLVSIQEASESVGSVLWLMFYRNWRRKVQPHPVVSRLLPYN